jgi:hypothetical protein
MILNSLKTKRSIGHNNQRGSSMLLRLLAIAASVPAREIKCSQTSWAEDLVPGVTGLYEDRLTLAPLRMPIQK